MPVDERVGVILIALLFSRFYPASLLQGVLYVCIYVG